MASIREELLWNEFNGCSDDEAEIGSLPMENQMTICLSEKSPSGEHIFSREIPAKAILARREFKPFKSFFRLEVKVDQHNPDIKPGDELIVSQFPRSNKWVHFTEFKPSNRHRDRNDGNIPAWIKTSDRLKEFIDNDAPVDYFETGNFLTAGISKPLSGSEHSRQRNMLKNAVYLFGACRDVSRAKEELFASEHIRELLYLTEINKIRYIPSKNMSNFPLLPRLKDEVIENRFNLMVMAILQALSGPVDSTKYIGTSLCGLVELCYKQLLHFENRRCGDGRVSDNQDTGVSGDPSDVDSIPSGGKSPEGMVYENFINSRIRECVGILLEDEYRVITHLFGIGADELSEEEVLDRFGWTRHYFMKIRKSARAKLRSLILEDPDLRTFVKYR